jgi:hypothetical protein
MPERTPIAEGGELQDRSLERQLEQLLPELLGSNREIASGLTGFGSRRDAYAQRGDQGRRQWDNAMSRARRRSRRTTSEALRGRGRTAGVSFKGMVVVSQKPDRRRLPAFDREPVDMDGVVDALARGDLPGAAEELFEAFKDAYDLEFDLSDVSDLQIVFD